MKRLLLLGGTMGVGKTTAGRALKSRLSRCVYLDGDWCWDMHPFLVNEQTCAMVLDNIRHLLTNFLRCPELDTVILGWVMDRQDILSDLLRGLPLEETEVHCVSLVCTEAALRSRCRGDVARGLRTEADVDRAAARLARYTALNTEQLDVSGLSVEETVDALSRLLYAGEPASIRPCLP